jgi:hypothetical protein
VALGIKHAQGYENGDGRSEDRRRSHRSHDSGDIVASDLSRPGGGSSSAGFSLKFDNEVSGTQSLWDKGKIDGADFSPSIRSAASAVGTHQQHQ